MLYVYVYVKCGRAAGVSRCLGGTAHMLRYWILYRVFRRRFNPLKGVKKTIWFLDGGSSLVCDPLSSSLRLVRSFRVLCYNQFDSVLNVGGRVKFWVLILLLRLFDPMADTRICSKVISNVFLVGRFVGLAMYTSSNPKRRVYGFRSSLDGRFDS